MEGTSQEFVQTLQKLHELFNAQTRTLEQELLQSQAVVVDQRNLIGSLEGKVAKLNARAQDAEAAQDALLGERAQLLDENVQLANALQVAKAELAKLVHFKQAIRQTFDTTETQSGHDSLNVSLSSALNVADRYSAFAASELAHAGTGIPPPSSPTPQGHGGSTDELIAEINRSLHSPPRATAGYIATPAPAPASPSPSSPGFQQGTFVDGREFFRQARTRLGGDVFNDFVGTITALNEGKMTRDQVLQRAWDAFGAESEDLYRMFKALISKQELSA